MFNLLPWKKQHADREVGDYEPTRQSESIQGSLPSLRSEFDSAFSRLFDERLTNRLSEFFEEKGARGTWDMGWEDQEKEYQFRAELPGFEPDDIDVNVSGNLLTVRAERKAEGKKEDGSQSYQYGAFRETLTIPQGVKADEIDAQYRNGVLQIRLPKDESAQGRRIAVKSS